MIGAEGGAVLFGVVVLIVGIVTSTCASPKSFPISGILNLIAATAADGDVAYFTYIFGGYLDDILDSAQTQEKDNEEFQVSFIVSCIKVGGFVIAGVVSLNAPS